MHLLRPLHEHKDCFNRRLHYGEYVAYLLLYFFNPLATSLRGLRQLSTLRKVQDDLGLPQFSLGSFSEARNVFDPALLEPVLGALVDEALAAGTDPRLAALDVAAMAVDGSLLPTSVQSDHASRVTGHASRSFSACIRRGARVIIANVESGASALAASVCRLSQPEENGASRLPMPHAPTPSGHQPLRCA